MKYGPATTDEVYFGAFELAGPARLEPSMAPAWYAVAIGGLWILCRRVSAGRETIRLATHRQEK